jgi:hypothetical protein
MGIANPSPNVSTLIPKNYFCHFVVDLADRPAKIDIIMYEEKYLGYDEYIDIEVNRTSRGQIMKDYFSDQNIRLASFLDKRNNDRTSSMYISENEYALVNIYALNLEET